MIYPALLHIGFSYRFVVYKPQGKTYNGFMNILPEHEELFEAYITRIDNNDYHYWVMDQDEQVDFTEYMESLDASEHQVLYEEFLERLPEIQLMREAGDL